MKKLTAILLAVLMLAALAIPAMAATSTVDIKKDTVLKGTPTIDGKIDPIYQQSLTVEFSAPSYYGIDIESVATAYALYDDNYVYVAAYVTDTTPYEIDADYLANDAHPHKNDAFEIRIATEGHMAPYTGSFKDHHLFYVDSQGRRFTSYQEQVDGFFGKTIYEKGKGYTIEVAIPLTSALVEGESIAFNFQVDNMTAQADAADVFGATGIADTPSGLVEFKVGGAVAGGSNNTQPSTPSENTNTNTNTNTETNTGNTETNEAGTTEDGSSTTTTGTTTTNTNGSNTTSGNTSKPSTSTAPKTADTTLIVLGILVLSVAALVTFKKVTTK